jgi:hypothetical protein
LKTIIHVNQHIIRANGQNGFNDPPLTIKDYKQNRRGHTADIVVDGKVVASVVYRPHKPLSCGAKCWIETHNEVVVK